MSYLSNLVVYSCCPVCAHELFLVYLLRRMAGEHGEDGERRACNRRAPDVSGDVPLARASDLRVPGRRFRSYSLAVSKLSRAVITIVWASQSPSCDLVCLCTW